MKLSNQLTGAAGEYFVAAELSIRNYIASISLRNAKGVDILATTEASNESINIQVKTTKNQKPSWLLSQKNEHISSSRFFYIFVLLPSLGNRPVFYIVPSSFVSSYITTNHLNYLRANISRKNSSMRVFDDIEHEYKERWDLLETHFRDLGNS